MIDESFIPGLPLLLIDDNPQNLRLATFLLNAEGFQVRTAESAEHALELLATEQFTLILVDIQLPGMDGLELTRHIRNTPVWADLIIVALTAYAMRGDEKRMLAAGCNGYISKPINTRTFCNEVKRYLVKKNCTGTPALPFYESTVAAETRLDFDILNWPRVMD